MDRRRHEEDEEEGKRRAEGGGRRVERDRMEARGYSVASLVWF